MVAEVPETLAPPASCSVASGYVQEAVLTDYVLERPAASERGGMRAVEGFVIPVTVDDLAANGLLGEADPQVCWERSVETLTARKDDIAGLAVASDERIEAYLLFVDRGVEGTEIVSLRSFIEDGGARLKQLLAQLRAQGTRPCGSRRSTRRRSQRRSWRGSVSARRRALALRRDGAISVTSPARVVGARSSLSGPPRSGPMSE